MIYICACAHCVGLNDLCDGSSVLAKCLCACHLFISASTAGYHSYLQHCNWTSRVRKSCVTSTQPLHQQALDVMFPLATHINWLYFITRGFTTKDWEKVWSLNASWICPGAHDLDLSYGLSNSRQMAQESLSGNSCNCSDTFDNWFMSATSRRGSWPLGTLESLDYMLRPAPGEVTAALLRQRWHNCDFTWYSYSLPRRKEALII